MNVYTSDKLNIWGNSRRENPNGNTKQLLYESSSHVCVIPPQVLRHLGNILIRRLYQKIIHPDASVNKL